MKSVHYLVGLLLFASISIAHPISLALGQTNEQTGADTQLKFEFPEDAETPVLEFTFTGGFRMAPPRAFKPEPRLRVYQDGRVVCGQYSPRVSRVEYQMSKEQLVELLDFVINEQKLLELQSGEVKQQINATGRPIMIADAPSSQFKANVNGRIHELEIYALGMIGRQYPEVDEVQKALDIQNKLQGLYNRALLGTDKEAKAVLEEVNKALKAEMKQDTPLKISDLASGVVYQNGNRSFTFQRTESGANGKPGKTVSVTYSQTAGEKPKCTARSYNMITPGPRNRRNRK